MKTEKYNIRGTEINKIQFSEIEDLLSDKGINVNKAFELMADDREFVYVSNGFVRGLNSEINDNGEWHHFFKKESDGSFISGKFQFN